MPAQQTDYDAIREAQKRSRDLMMEAAQLSAGSKTFADRVMNRVREARVARGITQLERDIGTTAGQLASEGASLRERTAEVNPLDVDRMLAAQRGQTLGSLTTMAEAAQAREGTLEEILTAGTNRLVAQAQIKQAEAEMAAQEARDIMDLLELQSETTTGAGPSLSINEAIKLQKFMQEQQAAVSDADRNLNNLNRAIHLLETGEVSGIAGPIRGRTLSLRALYDPKMAEFLGLSQEMTTKKMFNIGGKTLPQQEISRLEPYLPTAESMREKSQSEILRELKELRNSLRDDYNALIETPSFLPYTEEFSGLGLGALTTGLDETPDTRQPLSSFEE